MSKDNCEITNNCVIKILFNFKYKFNQKVFSKERAVIENVDEVIVVSLSSHSQLLSMIYKTFKDTYLFRKTEWVDIKSSKLSSKTQPDADILSKRYKFC